MARYHVARRYPQHPSHVVVLTTQPNHTLAVRSAAEILERQLPDFNSDVQPTQLVLLLDLSSIEETELPSLLTHDPLLNSIYELGRLRGADDARRRTG